MKVVHRAASPRQILEREMPDTPLDGTPVTEGTHARSLSAKAALVVAIVGAAVAAGASAMVLQGGRGTGFEALLGALALAAFGVAAYGVIQAVLAVIDTAGERRRQDREVSERRTGERARPPRQD